MGWIEFEGVWFFYLQGGTVFVGYESF
jgi:hypothetical protein